MTSERSPCLVFLAAIATIIAGPMAQAGDEMSAFPNLANCLRAELVTVDPTNICNDLRIPVMSAGRQALQQRQGQDKQRSVGKSAERAALPLSPPDRREWMAPENVALRRTAFPVPIERPVRGCTWEPDLLLGKKQHHEQDGGHHAEVISTTRKSGVAVVVPGNCLIRSPIGGEVVFAQRFSGYGQTIIVKHGISEYLIVAGLANLMVTRGAHIGKGAELGRTTHKNAAALDEEFNPSGRVILYLDVRSKNGPRDPLVWLAALS